MKNSFFLWRNLALSQNPSFGEEGIRPLHTPCTPRRQRSHLDPPLRPPEFQPDLRHWPDYRLSKAGRSDGELTVHGDEEGVEDCMWTSRETETHHITVKWSCSSITSTADSHAVCRVTALVPSATHISVKRSPSTENLKKPALTKMHKPMPG